MASVASPMRQGSFARKLSIDDRCEARRCSPRRGGTSPQREIRHQLHFSFFATMVIAAVDVFRVVAACTATLMLLTPVPTIYRACKTKSTGVASIVPLVSMLANSHILIFYGYLTEDYFPIFSTFVAGDVLCLIYIAIFYCYSHERAKARKVFLLFGIPLAIVTLYAVLGGYGLLGQSRHATGIVIGYIGTFATILLYASPFERIRQVLQHKSGVFLNIHMVCASTFNHSVWVAYAALSRQWLILAPNVFCCAMGCLQILLYLIYHPSTHPYQGTVSEQFDLEIGDGLRDKRLAVQGNYFVPITSPLQAPTSHSFSR